MSQPQEIPQPAITPTPNQTPSFRAALYTPSELATNPTLNAQLIHLINVGFSHSHNSNPEIWDLSVVRFPKTSGLIDMLGTEGICAVVFATTGDSEVPVASAAAVPMGKGDEALVMDAEGWELKTVVATPEGEFRKKGLAGRCCALVEEYLVKKEREVRSAGSEKDRESGKLKIWIQTMESKNGAYWQRRGFNVAKTFTPEVGHWGSKKPFTIMVGVKEVDIWGEEGKEGFLRGEEEGVRSVEMEKGMEVNVESVVVE